MRTIKAIGTAIVAVIAFGGSPLLASNTNIKPTQGASGQRVRPIGGTVADLNNAAKSFHLNTANGVISVVYDNNTKITGQLANGKNAVVTLQMINGKSTALDITVR